MAPLETSRPSRRLEARRLSVRRGGRQILDGASITLIPGEPICLQGKSGSGKTTFLRVIGGLERADEGAIYLGEIDVETIAPPAYRRAVAFLSQRPTMLPGTVGDNLQVGPRLRGCQLSTIEQQRLMEKVGLSSDRLSSDARELSGGERQRLAMARALANQPEILILDEPAASLDPQAGDDLMRLVATLASSGLGILLVTHIAQHMHLLRGQRYQCDSGKIERME